MNSSNAQHGKNIAKRLVVMRRNFYGLANVLGEHKKQVSLTESLYSFKLYRLFLQVKKK
jgi:hypothetical protein